MLIVLSLRFLRDAFDLNILIDVKPLSVLHSDILAISLTEQYL